MAEDERGEVVTPERVTKEPACGIPRDPTPEEARAILEAESRERAKACWTEIQDVLKRHECTIRARPYIDADGATRAEFGVFPI